MRNYFIDTNLIIDFLANKLEAVELIISLAKDDEGKIFINRLVNLESLRTIPIKNSKIFKEAKEVLDDFEKLDIKNEIYEKTIEFSRYFKTVKHQSLKGRCEAIDLLHFITAKYYGLELLTYDSDFDKLEKFYQEFLEVNRLGADKVVIL